MQPWPLPTILHSPIGTMQSLTGFNLSYASGKRDRQWESAVLVCIGISSLKANNSLRFPPENRPVWNDLNLLSNCKEKQHKNRLDGSWEGWTSERRMLGADDKTMEFRDTDEWRSRRHQICCLKITSKQINMSGRGRDGGGKKMREEERRVKQETAWPMQLPAATEDPGECRSSWRV